MSDKETNNRPAPVDADEEQGVTSEKEVAAEQPAREYGGPKGREPTRYGDWEKNGRCIDF